MNKTKLVLLPGLKKQLSFLMSRINPSELQVLILGSGTANIAKQLVEMHNSVEIVVEDYDSLMNIKLEIENSDEINAKIMDFERTDYADEKFDLVYVQGSLSDIRRKKIIKEVKRVIKPNGYLCVGEVVTLVENPPVFVEELFEFSNLDPLYQKKLLPYYEERNFELIDSIDLSGTLAEYYQINKDMLKEKEKSLDPNEKSYYKKILNQISHESNAYLKLGADKFIGFEVLLLKKNNIQTFHV